MSPAVKTNHALSNPPNASSPQMKRSGAKLLSSIPAAVIGRRNSGIVRRGVPPYEALVSPEDGGMLRMNTLGKHARNGVAGYRLEQGSPPVFIPLGATAPMQLGVPKMYRLTGRGFALPAHVGNFYPFRQGRDPQSGAPCILMPLQGDFYISGKKIPASQMSKVDIRELRSSAGQAIHHWGFIQGGRGLLLPGTGYWLRVRPTKEGGRELVTSSQIDPDETIQTGVAVQLRANGGLYRCHLVERDANGAAALRADEAVLTGGGTPSSREVAYVQRRAYLGRSGFFLDNRHEHYGDSPSGGGSAVSARKDEYLDALLWRRGAVMGGVVIDSVSLLTRDQLALISNAAAEMPCEELRVSLRFIFRDTRRLSALIGPSVAPVLQHERTSLTDLCRTIGHNLKICCDSGLTIKTGQVTADNLSADGGILDSENFTETTNRYQIISLVMAWVHDAAAAARTRGISTQEFVRGPLLRELGTAMLGARDAAQVCDNVSSLEPRDSTATLNLVAKDLARRWVHQSLACEQKVLVPEQLLAVLERDPRLAEYLGLAGGEKGRRTFRRAISSRVQEVGRERFLAELVDSYILLALDSHELLLIEPARQDERPVVVVDER